MTQDEAFKAWWYNEGSQPPYTHHDCEEHTMRMCEIAWNKAVAAEREACAKVCEEQWEIDGTRTAQEFATAIRARGQTDAMKLALEALEYNHQTGQIFWRKSRGTKKVGSESGAVNGKGYVCIMLGGKCYQAHRLAWLLHYKEMPSQDIDHINGVKTDNRISNLRLVTVRQNQYNQRKPRVDNKSGYLGVTVYKNKWMASIKINSKTKHLGYFSTPEQASEAYIKAKREHHETCTI